MISCFLNSQVSECIFLLLSNYCYGDLSIDIFSFFLQLHYLERPLDAGKRCGEG